MAPAPHYIALLRPLALFEGFYPWPCPSPAWQALSSCLYSSKSSPLPSPSSGLPCPRNPFQPEPIAPVVGDTAINTQFALPSRILSPFPWWVWSVSGPSHHLWVLGVTDTCQSSGHSSECWLSPNHGVSLSLLLVGEQNWQPRAPPWGAGSWSHEHQEIPEATALQLQHFVVTSRCCSTLAWPWFSFSYTSSSSSWREATYPHQQITCPLVGNHKGLKGDFKVKMHVFYWENCSVEKERRTMAVFPALVPQEVGCPPNPTWNLPSPLQNLTASCFPLWKDWAWY